MNDTKGKDVIDAEFEPTNKEEPKRSSVSAFANEVADVADVFVKPLKRISPETAHKIQTGAEAARTLGETVDDVVDKAKAIGRRVKEGSEVVGEAMRKIRPTPVMPNRWGGRK